MKPDLSILPEPQKLLWPQLSKIPNNFILYGGTAIALQLGHRQSVDFDFFSAQPLDRPGLIKQFDLLQDAKIVQPELNTLECFLSSENTFVKFQFLAGIGKRLGRVDKIQTCDDNGLQVASLRDLFGTKLHTIQARAELKDYLDIYAILEHGLALAEGLGCSQAIFGEQFDPATSLRALCSYHDGDLFELPKKIKDRLRSAAAQVDNIPYIPAISETIT